MRRTPLLQWRLYGNCPRVSVDIPFSAVEELTTLQALAQAALAEIERRRTVRALAEAEAVLARADLAARYAQAWEIFQETGSIRETARRTRLLCEDVRQEVRLRQVAANQTRRQQQRRQAVALLQAGHSLPAVAAHFGQHPVTIKRWVRQAETTGARQVRPRTPTGCPTRAAGVGAWLPDTAPAAPRGSAGSRSG